MPDYNKNKLTKKLKKLDNLTVKTEVPLKKYTSFQVGGPADIFIIPQNISALKKLIGKINFKQIPVFILGKGTNIIAGDRGFKGIIIHTINLNQVEVHQNTITAESGISLSNLAQAALKNNLSGLEFASGIPGSLGGALCMNAGAYGQEMKDIVEESLLYDYSGVKQTATNRELNFAYRHSLLKEKPLIAVRVKMTLKPACNKKIKELMKKLNKKRKDKQPLKWPSAGSIFKRPPDNYAGSLIEKTGLKGLKIGDAEVSRKHAGFIINKGRATATDIKKLIFIVQQKVYEKFGIKLEPEPIFIGEFNEI